jgi:hypothetical protein
MMDYRTAVCFLLTASCLTVACGGGSEQARQSVYNGPQYTEDGLRIIRSDVNDDGIPDVTKYFEEVIDDSGFLVERNLVRTEIDLTGDGLVNMRREYDEFGDLVLELLDGNLDGRFDDVIVWEDGAEVSSERDSDFDGEVDEYRYFRQGLLYRVERDTDGDGELDTWSYYDRHGLARVGVDINDDGEPDTWTRRGE